MQITVALPSTLDPSSLIATADTHPLGATIVAVVFLAGLALWLYSKRK